MASMKREAPRDGTDENDVKKKTKLSQSESENPAPPVTAHRVILNPGDCDLDFNIEGGGLSGSALHDQGFAYCWAGARANVGLIGGKYCFGCKIIFDQPVIMEETPLDQQHVCRLGISRGDDSVGKLGETEHSFGFGGTGKFANAGKFFDYGEKFGVGDTIVCAVNLENNPLAEISFSKNGKFLGTARRFNAGPNGLGVVGSPIKNSPWESAVFPHILLKNVVVELQFSPEDGLLPEEGYKPWSYALRDGNAVMGPSLQNIKDCEVIMMVGLPASGKTTWAEKWVREHPDKRYILLGTNLALDQMKVPGLLRKNNYGERFEKLMGRATGIFNTLLSRASKTPRNFILDQTNVYKSARKRKLKPFADFHKVAVVVFPKPEELKSRADKRFKEMGKEVPAEAVNEMLANYVLPMSKDMRYTDEYFDEVIFPELSRDESQRCLDVMKRDLKSQASGATNSVSPYSRESSVQSFGTSQPRYQDTVSGIHYGSLGGGYQQSSSSPVPSLNYNYQRSDQANPSYLGDRIAGQGDPCSAGRLGDQTPSALDAPYRNYGGYNQPKRLDVGSGSPGYAMGGYIQPNVQNRNPSFMDVKPSYNTFGGHAGYAESLAPQMDMQAFRHSSVPPNYSSTYGAPCGTPAPGHLPSHMPPPGPASGPPQGYPPPAYMMPPGAPAPDSYPPPGPRYY